MFDITFVLKAVVTLAITLVTTFVVPWVKEKLSNAKTQKALGIIEQVVWATWELEITGELLAIGQSKAEYAWAEAKKLLAEKNLTVNDDELKAYIKSAVAALRIARKDEITEPTA